MTTEELRAIDAEVAEKVMGWCYMTDREGRVCVGTPFEPSTDITAAWLVVEKLRVEFGGEDIAVRLDGCLDGWDCEIGINLPEWDDYRSSTMFSANAETAPLAICKAALECYAKRPNRESNP